MFELAARLKHGAAILDELEQKRVNGSETEDDYDLEYSILIAELWDLEEEILMDPGPLLPYLLPNRSI